jgi:NAD(P)-dependent dehydrogenase (short-subunit alcohol dehydrogenase family)
MIRILALRVLSVEGKMSNTHAGKVAIVTGSARGIGAAIASQLASESAKVVVNYNTGEAAALQGSWNARSNCQRDQPWPDQQYRRPILASDDGGSSRVAIRTCAT